jgi:hypothetical protein
MKRRAERQRRPFRVTLGCAVSFTVDVSSGGFCTETMLALPVGTMIQGSVQGPRKKVWFSGRIAWAEPGDCTLSLRGRMGIALADAGAELFGHRDAGVTP